MEINQILVTASPSDAITDAALALRRLFRRIGRSEIFARHVHPDMASEVLPLTNYSRRLSGRPNEDILFYHASIGEPDVHAFLMERSETLVVLYHNISPYRPFLSYDPGFAGLLEAGRRELQALRERTSLALAVSAFNAADLESMGYTDVAIAPLAVDLDGWDVTESDEQTAWHLENVIQGPLILFVGQILPHKRPDAVIKAYHALVTYLEPDAHVVIVGTPRLRRYFKLLQTFVQELNLPNVWLTGTVSQAQLAAFYRRADVFLTLSDHEGFCVPLLEAMHFKVPIVAKDSSAIPETLGGAGVLLPAEDNSLLSAEMIYTMLNRRELRERFIQRGCDRLASFSAQRCEAILLKHLIGVLS